MNAQELWNRYQTHLCRVPAVGLTLDISRMTFDDGFLARMAPAMQKAFAAMDALEKGAIANPDEKRMVGHYWLRAPELAPTPEIAAEIRDTLAAIKAFAAEVHSGKIKPPTAAQVHPRALDRHRRLGARAEVRRRRPRRSRRRQDGRHFIDNTDPDGIARDAGAARRHGSARPWSSSSARAAARRRPATACSLVADAYRKARPRLRPARRRRHRHRLAARPAGRRSRTGWPASRCGTGSAAAPASCRPSAWSPAASRGSTSTAMLAGAAACDEATRAHDTAEEPRRPAGPDVASRHRRQGREGHGRPALQGPAAPVQPLPPAARDGVARQAARPRRQARRPGDRRLRQQGLDRPARLRPAAARRREQLLRHLHPRARGRRQPRSRSSPASRPATTCTASCSAPARPSSRTTASR